MTIDLYFGEGAPHDSISSNYESTAFDAHELAAVKRFPLVNSIGPGDLVTGVAQQREGKPVLFDEFLMGGGSISAHSDDLSARGVQQVKLVAETACLSGASRGRALGIKVKHHVPALREV